MPKLSLILIAAFASTVATAPAYAQDDAPPSISVRYDDLNLDTSAGRAHLDNRVRYAIKTMCASDPRPTLTQRAAALKCVATAKRSIEPQLAALYNGSRARLVTEKPTVAAAP